MNKNLESRIGSIKYISNGERLVLQSLANEMDPAGLCLTTIENLECATGYAPETVKNHLRSLRKKMLISTMSHRLRPPFEINLNDCGGRIE